MRRRDLKYGSGQQQSDELPPPPNPDLIPFVQLNNEFARDMTKILRDSTAINSVYSPFYIRNLMAMMRIGANDLSALEIDRGLKLYSEEVPSTFGDYARSLTKLQRLLQDLGKKPEVGEEVQPQSKSRSRLRQEKPKIDPNSVRGRQLAAAAATRKPATTKDNESTDAAGVVSLSKADRIYITQGFEISTAFKKTLQNMFNRSIQEIDFNDSVQAADKINLWCKKKTGGKIESVVPPVSLNGLHTRLVLLSAVHFHGDFLTKFSHKRTKPGEFIVTPTKSVDCQMMERKGPTFYTDLGPDVNCNAIGLPYVGERLMLLIISTKKPKPSPPPPTPSVEAMATAKTGQTGASPSDSTAIAATSESVTAPLAPVPTYVKPNFIENRYIHEHEFNIDEIVPKMSECNMEVKLPKFKLEHSTHFIQPFKQLGMRTVFDPTSANFAGISGYDIDGLFISEVIQKVVLEVGDVEEPSLAKGKRGRLGKYSWNRGAATAIVYLILTSRLGRRPMTVAAFRPFGSGGGPRGGKGPKKKKAPKSITIDHPFVFYIVDKFNHNLVLFSGYCSNPNVSTETLRKPYCTTKLKGRSRLGALVQRNLRKAGIC